MANDRRIQEGGKQKQERMTSEQKKNEWHMTARHENKEEWQLKRTKAEWQ